MRAGIADLVEVEGVGEARARAIKDGLSRLAETSILDRYVVDVRGSWMLRGMAPLKSTVRATSRSRRAR